MVDMFALVLPEKVAEEVVKKDVKLIYDPATKELVQIVMPFDTSSEVTMLTVDKGWVTEASVEDVKLLPGVHRTMFRLHGRRLGRARSRASDPERAGQVRPQYRGHRLVGQTGPHRVRQPVLEAGEREVLQQLPAPDAEMRAAGLEGRFFPSIGNHEVWGDPKIEGVLSAVPY